jgi:hypothetical protein
MEGLRVNPQKTALIPFTHKRRDRNITTPTLFGERLTSLREVKYLGVILDDKLTWNQHIDSKVNRAKLCMQIFWKEMGTETKDGNMALCGSCETHHHLCGHSMVAKN